VCTVEYPIITSSRPPITRLNLSPSSPLRPPTAPVLDPEDRHSNRTNQPQQHIHKINPNSMLHPENARVALRVGLDVEVPEDAKDGDPKDKENRVPDEEEGNAADERDEVKEGGYGREGSSYFCKGPFPISILMLLVGFIQIHAIEPTNRQREDDLYESEDRVGDVRQSHFAAAEETHLCVPLLLPTFYRRRAEISLKALQYS